MMWRNTLAMKKFYPFFGLFLGILLSFSFGFWLEHMSEKTPATLSHGGKATNKNLFPWHIFYDDAVTPTTDMRATAATPEPTLYDYIEVIGGCGPHFEGACLKARRNPSSASAVVVQLRTGVVLQVASTTITDAAGISWQKIIFDSQLRYPERVSGNWYISATNTRAFTDRGAEDLPPDMLLASNTKHIVINRSSQILYAYDGGVLFLKTPVSTGLDLTPTPRGTFTVYRKTPSRYMQGPLPGVSTQYYDLPGVPWNLYFTKEGGAIHGAYWHNSFGKQWSHGCVNLPLDVAQKLYEWTPLGTVVTVRG